MASKSVESQLSAVLNNFLDKEEKVIEDAFKQTTKETVNKLKSTSPKRAKGGGAYAASWTKKQKRTRHGIETVVYNKEHYRLTHLLEKGHVIRNQFGTYGRVEGDGHIKDVEEWAVDELINKLERQL